MEVYRLPWGELTSLQHQACPSGDEHIHGVMSAARTAGLGAERCLEWGWEVAIQLGGAVLEGRGGIGQVTAVHVSCPRSSSPF